MKKNILMILIGAILITAGIYALTQIKTDIDVREIKEECTESTECILPMEFAVQSICPFQAACIKGSCAVICPMWEHSPNPEESISYEVSCSDDENCDCSTWDTQGKYSCKCIDGQCASVITN